jgi:hypothetical protein
VPCREETHSGEYGDVTPLQQHIVVGDHLHHFKICMVDERWRLVDQQSEGLFLVVLDGWDSVMTTREHLSWIPMDELLVESLGLTKACDTSQSYSQLQMFLLACPYTFIIDKNMRDRPWLGAWRVSRPRLYDRSTFTTYNRSEVDRVRHTVETWCVMVSIIDQVMTDERCGLPTMISLAQDQLVETGSDKLPSSPWDPGVHFVSRMFHYMTTEVAPESHTLHLGLIWREPVGTCPVGRDLGTCPVGRDLSSLVIIIIGHGYIWMGTSSIEMSLLIQFLDNKSNSHRYFRWKTQKRRIQDVCRGLTVRVRVVQCQHEDL